MTSHEVAGKTVTMPVLVRDASAGTVIFDVDLAAARAQVPDAFEVIESAPGKAQLALALIDYRDNDLGSYREVGTIFFVRPAGGGPDGNYISHLPVDQEFTCVAGNQIWGFPKTVQQIDVTFAEDSSRWVLTMDGELVLDVTIPRGGSDEMPAMELVSYTLLDGVACATAFSQGGTGSSMGFDGVTWTLGTHPVAKELEALGLSFVMTSWIENMQAKFEDAVPL
jgi:hypothetical protein